jgi:hypothetical protein
VIAAGPMITLAVTDVAVAVVIVPVMPAAPATTALAAARFVPVNVTVSVVPVTPLAGLIEVSVGTGAVTLKGSEAV